MGAIVIETINPIGEMYRQWFAWFEVCSVLVFTVEYLLRLCSCRADEACSSPIAGRLRFARSPMAIIDLLAFLPFYVSIGAVDLRVMRMLRVFRIFRAAKLFRYLEALKTFARILRSRKEELVLTLVILGVLLLLSSTVIYYT